MEALVAADPDLRRLLGPMVEGRRDQLLDLDGRRAEMEEAGVSFLLISPPPPGPSVVPDRERAALTRAINDELIAVCRAEPDRFGALAVLPLPDAEASLLELERIGGDPAVCGVEVFTESTEWVPDQASLEPVYEQIAALGLPVLLHPAFDRTCEAEADWALAHSLGAPFSSSLGALRLILGGTLDRVPGLQPVLPHLGGVLPFLAGRLSDQSGSGDAAHDVSHYLERRLLYDTCSFHRPALDCACATFGSERLMLGSDSPFRGSLARSVEFVVDSGLAEEQVERVLSTTARHHFRLPQPTTSDPSQEQGAQRA